MVSKSSEDVVEMKSENGRERKMKRDGLVKWEKFLPKMVLRVLLVEADDSTRQIIAALLRKCNYKVASVPDGLKAWEILKARPHDIDLILTEVDLPSISGYALLTLIREHEVCKGIPVIMMSKQDSVSTVYKCMLRGAADYLVKPIRRNELRNLWQHVWRRHSSIGGISDRDESVGQKRVEGTSENNSATNQSTGFVACVQRNKEQIEKGSDAESSCKKPDQEAENADMESLGHPNWVKSPLSEPKAQKQNELIDLCQKSPLDENKSGGLLVHTTEDVTRHIQREHAEVSNPDCQTFASSSRQIIDFMGASNTCKVTPIDVTPKFDCPAQLDLSLKRPSHDDVFETRSSEDMTILRPSHVSAFTRYTSKPMTTQCSTSPLWNRRKEISIDSNKNLYDITCCNPNSPGPPTYNPTSCTSLTIGQSGDQAIPATSRPQHKLIPVPVPIPVPVSKTNGPVGCQVFFAQSTPSLGPSSTSPQELSSRANQFCQSNFETSRLYDRPGSKMNSPIYPLHKLEPKFNVLAADQSGNGSFCSVAISHFNSLGYYGSASGSNSNVVDHVAFARFAAENNIEDPTGNSRSFQRKVALNKFRLKRKDRCFDKKVRYESRRKLAEQRPRVKGQFVRQGQTAENHGNSSCG